MGGFVGYRSNPFVAGAMFQGERMVFALCCGGAEASDSGWVMTLRIVVVGVTVAVGQVKFGPAAPSDDEVLTPSGGCATQPLSTLFNSTSRQPCFTLNALEY